MNKLQIIKRAKNDLLFFGRAVSPGMFTVRSADFHHTLADIYMDPSKTRVNIQAPRGHAKSSIYAGIGPLHDVVFDEGDTFIVLVSKTEGHAIRLLQTIKDIIEYSAHFRALFGYWGRQVAPAWKTQMIELRDPRNPHRKIAILVRGANQQMRGLKYINQRPTRVIYDDPEDETNTLTEEARDKTLNGLLKGIVPGLDPHRGRVAVIGTPIHGQGLVNILETNPGWENLHFKALNIREDAENFVEEEDQYWALWPEVMPVSRLLADRDSAAAMGRISTWYSEYQCEIVGDEDQLFRPEDLMYWDGTLAWDLNKNAYLNVTALGSAEEMETYSNPIRIPVHVFMGIDPASSTRRTADYSVIFVIAIDENKKIYCLEYFRKRVKPMALAGQIVAMFRKYKPQITEIESTGYQEMLRQYLREHIPDYIPGLEIKNQPRTKKSERIAGLQPEFAMNKVHLKTHMKEFEMELITFPRGKTDDLLDGYFYARKGAYIPYHQVIQDPKQAESYKRGPIDWMTL